MPENSRPRSRKPPVKTVTRTRDVYTEADGLFGRIADMVIENPARSGGFVMIALVAGAIVSNAAFFQTAHHPDPFFVTRTDAVPADGDGTPGVRLAVPNPGYPPSPSAKPVATGSAMQPVPPLPLSSPVPSPMPANLIADTQKALATLKLYDGTIDNRLGPQTKAAISAFEMKIGLTPTGQPTPRLLTLIRKGFQNARAADPVATGSISDAETKGRIKRVQGALNDIGYGPVPVDGRSGGKTSNAIRRFELDNGLSLTGEVNDALLAKLVTIGAMKSI